LNICFDIRSISFLYTSAIYVLLFSLFLSTYIITYTSQDLLTPRHHQYKESTKSSNYSQLTVRPINLDVAIVKKFVDDNKTLKYGLIVWAIMITLLFKMSSIRVLAEAILYFGSLYLIGSYLVVAYYFM
jgi:hypothetical protein